MEFNDLETVQNQIDNTDKSKKPKFNNRKLIATVALAVVVVALIAVLIYFVSGIISGSEGKKLAESLKDDLGKSIAMAEKNTGRTLETTSEYSVLKNIVDYDYICESKNTVKVGGIQMPEWAVFITIDNNDKISSVVYYNFKLLKSNWKGQKTSANIDTSLITYNMTKKEAEKIVSVSPLAVTYSNDDTTTYLYKYYYADKTDSGNEKAYYLCVIYNMDDIVRVVDAKESDYVSFIFK